MRDVLVEMLNIYQPNNIDWMGYKMTSDNPYTFHHIIERRDGGKYEINNGAILTQNAHRYLNYLDSYCPEAYEEYQKIFRFINSLNGPMDEELYNEIYEEIYYLAYEIEYLKKYSFREIPRDTRKEKKEERMRKLQQKVKSINENKVKTKKKE